MATSKGQPKTVNQMLHRIGLGMWRGLYMERIVGKKPDGSMKYEWGRKLSYRGTTCGRSPLIIAMEAWITGNVDTRWMKENQMGDYLKRCPCCGEGFLATRSDARTCSARCRKRFQREKFVTLSSRS